MKWRGFLHVDATLPFGLRSAPKIFNAVADAVEWMIKRQGIRNALHYLDDFIVFGSSGETECQMALDKALRLCHSLGVPIVRTQDRRPRYHPNISGHRTGLGGHGNEATKVKAAAPERGDYYVEKPEVMHQERVVVTGGSIATCLLCGKAR